MTIQENGTFHKTWLLTGFFHSAPGYILLEGDALSFTLLDTGTYSVQAIRGFGEQFGKADLYEKLMNDQPVELFKTKLSDIQSYHFPWYSFGGGATIEVDGNKVRLSFMQPQNTKFPIHKIDDLIAQGYAMSQTAGDVKEGVVFGRHLKSILQNR